MNVNNRITKTIPSDSRGTVEVVDEAVDDSKAIPVVFVTKKAAGGFGYDGKPDPTTVLDNDIKTPIARDAAGMAKVVDEDIVGNKAIPLVVYTKNSDGKLVPAELDVGGGGTPGDDSVGTTQLKDGAVTDTKLANPKVNKAGDTMMGPLDIIVNSNGRKMTLAKTQAQSGNNTAPTTIDLNSTYLLVGGTEYNTNSYRLIGFGYHRHGEKSHSPAVIGYQEINAGKDDMGDVIIATRNSTSDVAPSIHLRVKHDGQVEIEQADYVPASDKAVPNKKYVDGKTYAASSITSGTFDVERIPELPQTKIIGLTDALAGNVQKTALATIDPIADPTTATTEDIANKINEILTALKG